MLWFLICMLPLFTFLNNSFFFFNSLSLKRRFCVPSKTTRPLTWKNKKTNKKNHQVYPNWQWKYKATSSCLSANIIIFLLRAQCKTTKTTCSRWKKSDIIWHLPRMARLSPEEEKPFASKKRLRPHLSPSPFHRDMPRSARGRQQWRGKGREGARKRCGMCWRREGGQWTL